MKTNPIKEIDSKIAQVRARLTQLKDENYYTDEERGAKRPGLESQLSRLEQERERAVREIEVFDAVHVTAD